MSKSERGAAAAASNDVVTVGYVATMVPIRQVLLASTDPLPTVTVPTICLRMP